MHTSGAQLTSSLPVTAPRVSLHRSIRSAPRLSRGLTCRVSAQAGKWAPPTVADTKKKFLDAYNKPIPGIYSTVVNELLVQQHLIRYNRKYQYNSVFALGFVSVYEQIGEGLEAAERDAIFTAYIKALDESPDTYRKDAAALEEWAKSLDSAESVAPNADGDIGQKALAAVASQVADGKFAYSKFFAIGLFRLLELTGAKDPKALGSLVTALGVRQDMVNRDLLTYKGVLSKLSAAKELQEEYLARERRKAAERAAAKEAKETKEEGAAAPAATQEVTTATAEQ